MNHNPILTRNDIQTHLVQVCCPNCRYSFSTVIQTHQISNKDVGNMTKNARYSKRKNTPTQAKPDINSQTDERMIWNGSDKDTKQLVNNLKNSLYENLELNTSDINEKMNMRKSHLEASIINFNLPSSMSRYHQQDNDYHHQQTHNHGFQSNLQIFEALGNQKLRSICLQKQMELLAIESYQKLNKVSTGIKQLFHPSPELSSIAKAIGQCSITHRYIPSDFIAHPQK